MIEAPKDKPKSGISIDFNTPSDILAQVLYKLESRRAGVVLEDHFIAEGSMSPIPKGKQLKVSLKILWNQIESEIPRLIQETNEKVYAVLKVGGGRRKCGRSRQKMEIFYFSPRFDDPLP